MNQYHCAIAYIFYDVRIVLVHDIRNVEANSEEEALKIARKQSEEDHLDTKMIRFPGGDVHIIADDYDPIETPESTHDAFWR